MATLQTIETKINELIEQNKEEIIQAEEELTKTEQVILEAQAELLQAQREINSQKYTEAKTKLWTAEQTKELYDHPVISYEEYHEIISEITKLANKEQEDYYTQACEKLKEVVAIANIAVEKANKADQLLKKIEGQLTKNSESYKKDKTGAYLFYSGVRYDPQRALYKHKEQLERIINNFSK